MLLEDVVRRSKLVFGVDERLPYRSHTGTEIGRYIDITR